MMKPKHNEKDKHMTNLFKKITIISVVFLLTFILFGCSVDTTTTTSTSITTTSSISDTTDTSEIVTLEDTLEVTTTKLSYNLNAPFDPSSIYVSLVKASGSAIPLGPTVYEVTGYDSSTPGEITLTITYRDLTTTLTLTIVESTTNLIIDLAYYVSAQDLTGEALLNQLHTIINTNFQGKNYDYARTALAVTDKDPANSSKLILVYTGASVSNYWDNGITWNREHVWPQSLLGEDAGSAVNMASDLVNLKPSNPTINSNRGNKYYDLTDTAVSFTPRDEVKGDLARILFYMMTMYEVLELVNGTPSVHQMGKLDVLLDWNELDPVDDFERNRNEAIYGFQNNRNPFVDYPEFVNLIFDYLD